MYGMFIYIWVFLRAYSMYGIFTYIWVFLGANVGKYSIHGAHGCSILYTLTILKPLLICNECNCSLLLFIGEP